MIKRTEVKPRKQWIVISGLWLGKWKKWAVNSGQWTARTIWGFIRSSWLVITSKPYRRGYIIRRLKQASEWRVKWYKFWFEAPQGKLSKKLLLSLSWRRLMYTRSRTAITAAAIAIGSFAIIFLVSFGYGLQEVVTQKLVKPYSMRLTDVQSDSTALALTAKAVDQIKQVSGVEEVVPAVSLAGTLNAGGSKMDVVVVGTKNRFLEFVHVKPVTGNFFGEEAEQNYVGEVVPLKQITTGIEQAGEVAGVTTQVDKPQMAEVIDEATLNFRIKEDTYVPMRAAPSTKAPVLGYVRGSVMSRLTGQTVWGSEYQTIGVEGRWFQDSESNWWGKWVKTKSILYTETAPTVYLPIIDEMTGAEIVREGFVPYVNLLALSSQEVKKEKIVEQVLGITDSASVSATIVATDSGLLAQTFEEEPTNEAGALNALLAADTRVQEASNAAVYARADVLKTGGKDMVVSSALLNSWGKTAQEVLGSEVTMEYIIGGNLIKGFTGRVVSSPVAYKIVGVVEEAAPMVYTPLSDLTSMGVEQYSLAKILVNDTKNLAKIRETIESMGFTSQSLVDTLIQVNKLFRFVRFVLAWFGFIALVVALFGMFNTLTVSLLERTREVGVMKTLGTTDRDVVNMFVTEALLVGMIGGGMGVIAGVIVGNLIDLSMWAVRRSASVQLFITPWWFAILVFMVAVLVGCLTGLYPAYRAKRISPLDSLRYE